MTFLYKPAVSKLLAATLFTCLSLPTLAKVKVEESATATLSKPAIPAANIKQPEVKEITWDNLMPPPDQAVVDRYNAGKMSNDDVIAYLDKLGQKTVTDINNTYGKLPGYLVPLNMDKNQIATELLLVPTVGACIHVPPPPPNQTVYISFQKGIKVTEAGYTPYWAYGTITVEKKSSTYTDAFYSMKVDRIVEYE